MRKAMQGAFGFNPFAQMEQQTRQSMAMFEQAMKMFNPFMAAMPGMTPGSAPGTPPAAADTRERAAPPVAPVAPAPEGAREGDTQAIDDLRRKLEELQSQLAQISTTRREG
jgi:polyhydroxyalkanoate synthesis regulator protein